MQQAASSAAPFRVPETSFQRVGGSFGARFGLDSEGTVKVQMCDWIDAFIINAHSSS